MQLEESLFLVAVPGHLVDCRVEMVVPSFPALLARPQSQAISLLQFLCDLRPVVQAVLRDQSTDGLILLNDRWSTSQLQDCLFIAVYLYLFIFKDDPARVN